MWHRLDSLENFFAALLAADEQLAEREQKLGCPCGGRLHRADYPRKPRGVSETYEQMFTRRFSFCCDRAECRKRRTPPSVRFFGRRLYVAAVVLACSAAWMRPEQASVPTRTAGRWRRFFRREFVASLLWQSARARFMPPVTEDELPASLLARFVGSPAIVLRRALEFLAPTSTRSSGLVMDG